MTFVLFWRKYTGFQGSLAPLGFSQFYLKDVLKDKKIYVNEVVNQN